METGKPKKPRLLFNISTAIIIFFALTLGYSLLTENQAPANQISLSELVTDINAGKVSALSINGDAVEVTYTGETPEVKAVRKEDSVSILDSLKNLGVDSKKLSAIGVTVKTPSGFSFWFFNLAPFILPLVFILVFIWFLSRQVRGAGMQAFSFGQSKARMIAPDDKRQRVTFKDVAGVKEAKEELSEVVDFLKNPRKFFEIGARIPKGMLLMGAPGTGKTLLARAVAGEAGVAFFSISGSEFVEMFVGVGASRVRDLFKLAKHTAPAIIFIDEIDAVGRVRGTGVGGGNDEREQTLNQILVEMDGFEPTEKVIVMAATNRPDVLDPALLRPGRFDRRVILDLPDRNDREEILKLHSRKKPFAEDVNLRVIAERTPGFSGADLYSLMNEGAILAARENRTKVSQYDLIRAIEKVMLGPERKSHLLSVKEKEITAYHEAGHALVASVLPFADPVHKISIISRGRAGGYTLKLPLEDRRLQSRREFLDDISVSLAGFVAEQMMFNDVTTGPSNDLQVASALTRDMVTKYGMSEKLGPIAYEASAGVLYGKPFAEREYSERISAEIDSEVSHIVEGALKKATDVLTKHKKALQAIAGRLIEVETIERDDFEKLLIANGIVPKRKAEIEHKV
ncbi:MAG: cell division protein FtsH [Candidatus Taylorbacteria bacterium RIFCSPHIGHO2_01_FULL_46_22b]|uniref:ATP-dependent zinc metalloprotease FtsH n=1 Tax=Candidatus Taylorbacteria bacterium RIFCSPHIGHO2_01_FULL_46_22b TaxID=1802301 RepID=A0A1G2M2Z4_9BACT|nr:MAG: cell division protein FtsH [Candidatus Taylorbacteria bacterium RIFCSPHIGHO2_01_FULL_46_22b]